MTDDTIWTVAGNVLRYGDGAADTLTYHDPAVLARLAAAHNARLHAPLPAPAAVGEDARSAGQALAAAVRAYLSDSSIPTTALADALAAYDQAVKGATDAD